MTDEYLSKSADNGNYTIYTSFCKAERMLMQHYYPVCSISGGSDSDIVLDLIHKVDEDGKVKYFWIDTGLEYSATKEHLDYLEIIIYSAAEKNRLDVPIVSVITILLPNNMLYIKFDYHLDSKHLVQKYGDCVVMLDAEKQSADIYTELLHPNRLRDIIELTVALNELVDCGMTAVLEV